MFNKHKIIIMYRKSELIAQNNYVKHYISFLDQITNDMNHVKCLIIEYDCFRQITPFRNTFEKLECLIILNHPRIVFQDSLGNLQYFEANCILDQEIHYSIRELHVGQLNISSNYQWNSCLKCVSGEMIILKFKSVQLDLKSEKVKMKEFKCHIMLRAREHYVNHIKIVNERHDSLELLKMIEEEYQIFTYDQLECLSISRNDKYLALPKNIQHLRIRESFLPYYKIQSLSLKIWLGPLNMRKYVNKTLQHFKISKFNDRIVYLSDQLETLKLDRYNGDTFRIPSSVKTLSLRKCDAPLRLPSNLIKLIMKDYTGSLIECKQLEYLQLTHFNEHNLQRILPENLITLKLPRQEICIDHKISTNIGHNLPDFVFRNVN